MQTEAELRRDLAACYRLFDWMGWSELIFNHITVRLPDRAGAKTEYLINPFGLHYAEVTPDNLVAIDTDGNLREGETGQVNRAGFVIHSAIHAARHDAHCIMHVHTTAGSAVSCKEAGLRHDNFYSALMYGDVAYHDYEGIALNLDERERLIADEPAAWTELAAQIDPAGLQQLRSLARQARAEQASARPPAAARQLFRRLREALEKPAV